MKTTPSAPKIETAGGRRNTGAPWRLPDQVVLLLVLLEPLLVVPLTRNPFAAKELFFSLALLALAASRVLPMISGREPWPRIPAVPGALLATVVAVHATLAALSSDRLLSVVFTLKLAGFAALFALVASRTWDVRFYRRFFAAVLAGTVIASLYGILQHLHLDPVTWADTFRTADATISSVRIFSTFGHPNFFGPHLSMALFFIAALYLFERRPLPRAAAAAGIVLAAFCLLLTANRGSWVGLLAGTLAAAALRAQWRPEEKTAGEAVPAARPLPSRMTLVLVGAVLAAALTAVGSSEIARSRFALGKVLDDPTVRSRALIWSGALGMIRERPLSGFGPGVFGRVFPLYRDERLFAYHDETTPVTHAHNEYLEVLAETGVLGFLPLAAFAGAVFLRGYRKVKEGGSRDERLVHTALFAGAVSILVGGFFGVELRYANSSIFLWLLLGFLAAGRPGESGRPAPPQRGWVPVATAATAVAAAVACFVVAARGFAGEVHLERAERSLSHGAAETAAAEGKRAHSWNPAEPAGLMLAGEALVALKNYAGALEVYREVARINPGEPLIEYDQALMDYFLKRYDDGLARIESARKTHPRHEPSRSLHFDLWIGKTLELVRAGDYEGAKEAVRAAGLIRRNDPRAPFLLGNIHVLEHLYEPAADRYRRALLLDPDFRPAAENLKKIEGLISKAEQHPPPGGVPRTRSGP